jgi:hypothetical protein
MGPPSLQEYFLGTGGAFGLLSSLVGQSLPGSGPCVAVGNALMQGPVLFHFPQSLLMAIRERAAMGDMHLRQLELDLFRCSTGACICLVRKADAPEGCAAGLRLRPMSPLRAS